jgi:hypothetical protein
VPVKSLVPVHVIGPLPAMNCDTVKVPRP